MSDSRTTFMDDPQERHARLDDLAHERMPSRDLWGGIQSRLAPRPQAKASRWGSAGAALAAGVAGAVVAIALLRPVTTEVAAPALVSTATPVAEPNPEAMVATTGVAPVESRDADVFAQPGSPRYWRTLRAEHDDGLRPLSSAQLRSAAFHVAAEGRDERAPRADELQALLRAHLRMVSRAERELQRALRQDPQSEALNDLLTSTQRKRRDLQLLVAHN